MTLKQKKVLSVLDKNNLNVAKSMKEAGYSASSIRSGAVYNSIRRYTQKLDFFSEEKIKKDIGMTFRLAKKEKDITNMSRINEHRSKIAGMITDKQEVGKPGEFTDAQKSEYEKLRGVMPDTN